MPVDNLPGERIESLVDELEGIIEEARPPFGSRSTSASCSRAAPWTAWTAST